MSSQLLICRIFVLFLAAEVLFGSREIWFFLFLEKISAIYASIRPQCEALNFRLCNVVT